MTSIKARTVKRGLTSKGFDEVNRGETYCGTRYLTTMARQLGLNREELVQLVECPLSRDEYETLLRERGKL